MARSSVSRFFKIDKKFFFFFLFWFLSVTIFVNTFFSKFKSDSFLFPVFFIHNKFTILVNPIVQVVGYRASDTFKNFRFSFILVIKIFVKSRFNFTSRYCEHLTSLKYQYVFRNQSKQQIHISCLPLFILKPRKVL